jgi:hypothetical protein
MTEGLHMFRSDDDRRDLLDRAARATTEGGYVLVADTPRNLPVIESFFTGREATWSRVLKRKGFRFYLEGSGA